MRALSDLNTGESGIVREISQTNELRLRLLDLGLVPGTEVLCVLKSPLGDPVAYSVRGALIALRCDDSQDIIIE